MAVPASRPTSEQRITAALWFAERGFGVFPCWSARDDGACRCPAGASCQSPGKHPITADGFKGATTDPSRIRTFLAAASKPNYGLVAPDGVFILDVDGEGWQARLAELEARHGPLPPTLRIETAHGVHIFYRWPDGHPRPLRQLMGYVTRWGAGPHAGYVIGPMSVHASGFTYHSAAGSSDAIATLPDPWAAAGVEGHEGVRVARHGHFEPVRAGSRHDFLRDRARTLRGGGLGGQALFDAVMTVNEEYCVPPKSADEVRRAIGEVEERFDPDPPREARGDREAAGGMLVAEDPEESFPDPPHEAAYEGLLGECVDFLSLGTDASRIGLLASLVAFCGALMPAFAYWHGTHPSSPFLALVGRSGDGRKGTAMYRVRDALGHVIGMDPVNRARFDGVASGEALVKSLLARTSETFGVATGVLFEEEYATFLAAASREGSNLDSRMRSAFDGKQLSLRKSGETAVVPEPYYLSGLVAITPSELQRIFKKEGFTSGSGNRWLWLPVERRDRKVVSTEPIFPDDLRAPLLQAHQDSIRTPVRLAVATGADGLLQDYDDYLRATATGTAARMTRRFGVLALRVALVHASVERSGLVSRDHVLRAIALTDYALRGLTYSFGHAAGDADATHLLRMLRDTEAGELTMTDLKHDFIREPIRRQAAIDELQTLGLADVVKARTGGRPVKILRLRPQRTDFGDFGALLGTGTEPEAGVSQRGPEGAPKPPEGSGSGSGAFGALLGSEREADSGNSAPKSPNSVEGMSQRVPEGVPKVSESPPAEPAVDNFTGEVKDATADWARPCSDYAAHQDWFRGYPAGWVCLACHPVPGRTTDGCPDCPAGPFDDERYARHWHVEHGGTDVGHGTVRGGEG